jgi:hypothetical protein
MRKSENSKSESDEEDLTLEELNEVCKKASLEARKKAFKRAGYAVFYRNGKVVKVHSEEEYQRLKGPDKPVKYVTGKIKKTE